MPSTGLTVLEDPPLDPCNERERVELRPWRRVLDAFVAEALPDGGIDAHKSLWQAPGGAPPRAPHVPRGHRSSSPPVRAEGLYRWRLTKS